MATVSPSSVTISPVRKCSSTLKEYWILALPVALMVPFGLFGFRPAQLGKLKIGYIINTIVLLIYLLVLSMGFGYYNYPKDYRNTAYKFMAAYVILMFIKFILLIFRLYKHYNLFFLLEDIKKVRRNSLERQELSCIFVILTVILAMVMVMENYLISNVLEVFDNLELKWTPIAMDTNNPILSKFFAILEGIIYMSVTNISVLLTSFLVIVIAVVFSKEFEKCIQELAAEIKEDSSLSNNLFSKSAERFYELTAVLQKADDLLSTTIGFNVMLCLGMLCGGVYACLIGDGTFKEWYLPISSSIVTFIVLLSQIVALNSKVNNSFGFYVIL